MPIYVTKLTVPANTPEDSPAEVKLTVMKGVLTYVSVLIPYGHHALAGLRINYGDLQIIPHNEGEWIRGDGETLAWSDYEPIPHRNTPLRIQGYNEDDTYAHTFYIRLVVVPEKYLMPIELMNRVYGLFEKVLKIMVYGRGG